MLPTAKPHPVLDRIRKGAPSIEQTGALQNGRGLLAIKRGLGDFDRRFVSPAPAVGLLHYMDRPLHAPIGWKHRVSDARMFRF